MSVSLAACATGEAAGGARGEPPVSATLAAAQRAPFVARYEAVGTVAAKTTSPLASKIMGQVTAVRVREGDRVRAGQVLVEIEARDVAATVATSERGSDGGRAIARRSRPRRRGGGTGTGGAAAANYDLPK